MSIHPASALENPRTDFNRRSILKLSFGAALATFVTGCVTTSGRGPGVNLGRGDTGILNYALTLEGLEAEFYSEVLQKPYAGMTSRERQVLTDIRDHEIVHRDFLRRALGANAIPPLEYTFQRVNFSNRASVLCAARDFEDLGVAAYNGAGNAVQDPNILLVAGKIVSVEARHASAIRSLIAPYTGDFAPTPLDAADGARTVLKKADPFIVTKVNGNDLPDM